VKPDALFLRIGTSVNVGEYAESAKIYSSPSK
jgi:hypothetical protein